MKYLRDISSSFGQKHSEMWKCFKMPCNFLKTHFDFIMCFKREFYHIPTVFIFYLCKRTKICGVINIFCREIWRWRLKKEACCGMSLWNHRNTVISKVKMKFKHTLFSLITSRLFLFWMTGARKMMLLNFPNRKIWHVKNLLYSFDRIFRGYPCTASTKLVMHQ